MSLVEVGVKAMVPFDSITMLQAYGNLLTRRIMYNRRDADLTIDCCRGVKLRTLIHLVTGHLVLSPIPYDTIVKRYNDARRENNYEGSGRR